MEEDRELDSGETHSAKESAKEVKQLLPAGARVQLDENAGDERGVTKCRHREFAGVGSAPD